ncbi:sensor histidine kinase [Parablautia muri]|uniref:histidine kinase n=2 Tax=Clostridia TaxID=186801 RepID=N2A2J5_9FIRM|nr:HAMP domain-containing sensor histidine kinase [Parablautia muri]NBH28836.1 two-component sensor histidine kinase [Lachnospiraceae bacterium]NBJ95293.1 two-component sensor histidine kinase [Parablautia muri]
MMYLLLVLLNIILAFSLFSWKRQICEITKQISENKKLRISLSNKQIEKLAGIINEKKHLEQKTNIQIIQEKEQLKHSIANISHDLRTPLTSIQGYLTLLKDCEDKEEQEHYFSVIQAKTDYLTELVQIFYDLSLIESDDYILGIEKIDVNRIVTDCLINKYNELKELSPTIKIENAPVWITGNAVACKRIIDNLVTNAIRYSNDYIEIVMDADGIFTVKNTTSELKNIDVNILFQKFYTVDTSRSNGNTGLGLYIVKELLNKIEGGIKEISYKNNILTVSVYFKLYKQKCDICSLGQRTI